MSAYRNESVKDDCIGDFSIVLAIIIFTLWVGATIARHYYDTHIKFYNKTYMSAYDKCISDLPRNKDCEYVSMKFKIVSKK